MKNSIIRLVAVILCMLTLTASVPVYGAQQHTLTLTYSKEDIIFSDLEIVIHRISDCNFNRSEPYDSYPVYLNGVTSQSRWDEIAITLRSYIQADSIPAYMTAVTDSQGVACFNGIEAGLYLVCGVTAEAQDKKFEFYDFMIMVSEDLSAKPKSGIVTPSEEEQIYKVSKLWSDSSDNRPASVNVDILKDGRVYENIVLDASNDWSYSFSADPDSSWSVVERNVSDDYFVIVAKKETVFVITNVYMEGDDDHGSSITDTNDGTGTTTVPPGGNPPAPQTGDTFPMKRYMIMLCVSGMMIIVLGMGMRRKDNAQSR